MIREKEDGKTATVADRAQFNKCIDHCNMILSTLNTMHYNDGMLRDESQGQGCGEEVRRQPVQAV